MSRLYRVTFEMSEHNTISRIIQAEDKEDLNRQIARTVDNYMRETTAAKQRVVSVTVIEEVGA